MLFFLCALLFPYASLVTPQLVENAENQNASVVANITVTSSEINSESSSKQPEVIERSLTVASKSNVSSNETKIKKFDDFTPSRQFGGFEDKFPVNQQSKSFDPFSTSNWVANAWSSGNSGRQDESSIESPWRSTKVKFPAPTEARPYAFDNSYDRPTPITNPTDLIYRQPAVQQQPPIQPQLPVQPQFPVQRQLPVQPQIYPTRANAFPQPQQSMWQRLLGFTGLDRKFPISSPKSFFGDQSSYGGNSLDHSSYGGNNVEHNNYYQGGNSLDHHSNDGYYNTPRQHYQSVESHGEGGMSPWKKILKVLAAIIPIGLFISALTPTIITVTSANDTQNRFNRKAESADGDTMDKAATSLQSLEKLYQDGCQQKVFCELMVNAMFSNNAEEHIKNLLDNFVKGPGPNESTFTNILEAVKNQDCSPIICKDIEDPT